jgi:hypothetical protein
MTCWNCKKEATFWYVTFLWKQSCIASELWDICLGFKKVKPVCRYTNFSEPKKIYSRDHKSIQLCRSDRGCQCVPTGIRARQHFQESSKQKHNHVLWKGLKVSDNLSNSLGKGTHTEGKTPVATEQLVLPVASIGCVNCVLSTGDSWLRCVCQVKW